MTTTLDYPTAVKRWHDQNNYDRTLFLISLGLVLSVSAPVGMRLPEAVIAGSILVIAAIMALIQLGCFLYATQGGNLFLRLTMIVSIWVTVVGLYGLLRTQTFSKPEVTAICVTAGVLLALVVVGLQKVLHPFPEAWRYRADPTDG